MQFQNQYKRHYTYEVDSRGSSLEKNNDMYDYRNIEKLNNERINKLNFQLNQINLPINNSIQSISSSNYLNKNNRLNNNINNTLNENNTNNQYESYKSYLDNKYNSEIPNNNLNQYSPLKKSKNQISKNQEEDFNEKYDVKPRRRGSSKSENMREYNNIDNENIDNNIKRIRSHSIGDIPDKNENFNLNIDDENKFINEGNIYENNKKGNNNELKTSNNKNDENNNKKNVISETLLNPEYAEKVNNIKITEGQINPNDYRNDPRYSNNSNALANMIDNDKYSKINYLPQDSMNSNIRNKFNPYDNNNQYIDNNYNPLYNSQKNNDLYQSNFTEPYQRNVINPFINNNRDFNNNIPYNSQIIGNNPYDSFNKYNQNFPNYSDPRFNNNNYPFNEQNQQFNNSNDNFKQMNNPYYENNNNNEDNDNDNILSKIEYINPDDIRNRPPNEQLYLLANNNKLLYNALKNLQEKYNNLKAEYLKLLKVQESVKDNPTLKDLLMKDNDDLKRVNNNYEKMIEPLVDYVNDVNSSLGKKEIDLLDLKKLAKKYKEKKLGDEEDEMSPLDKFISYINKCKDRVVNVVEGESNKLKGKASKNKEGKRKIITFSDEIQDDVNDKNSDLNNVKNPNEFLNNDNLNNLKEINPNNKNKNDKNYEDSDDDDDNNNDNNKVRKLNKKKKNKNKDFYYWKKNKFTRGKTGRIISDSDEEIQEERKRINKFMIGEDKTYNYDYYNNRNWECPACNIGINLSSRGFSPLMCSPHRQYYIQNYENKNKENKNEESNNKENSDNETE
jgi:hypothetical protein